MARQFILNTGFEDGMAPWTFTLGSGVVMSNAHTGTMSGQLNTTAGATEPAEVSQFVSGPFTPFSLLTFSFFAQRAAVPATGISAVVTLFEGVNPVSTIQILIPAAANVIPPTGSNAYEYYQQSTSDPLPLGITGALVTISMAPDSLAAAQLFVDDIFLVEDIL
ncbi:MAG: hypothetical protein FH756_14440 [Firmicutes bacterium]|nr:hypothetical protein [Bacillota bacterium]